MHDEIVLACDLGGTNLRMAAINSEGKILHRVRADTPRSERSDEVVRVIIETAGKCRDAVRETGNVKALAAAVPAIIDHEQGIILKAPNLPSLDGFRFAATVSSELNVPVVLENDANAAAIGEQFFGAARGFQNSITVTLGTGVGGGIIINGENSARR